MIERKYNAIQILVFEAQVIATEVNKLTDMV
jgi:hypothetical protein